MPHLSGAVKMMQKYGHLILPTLQRYILREMGRTFVLTTIGLVGVLSMFGGVGVFASVPVESVSLRQMLTLLGLVIPTAAAFTLPIAALFSATITYGRLAADNEFTAVRSGGINAYVLFLPVLLLSLFSAIITFVFFNFVIPSLLGNIRLILRDSAKTLLAQYFRTGRGIDQLDRFQIRAAKVRPIGPNEVEDANFDGLLLEDVAFVEIAPERLGLDERGVALASVLDEIDKFGLGDSALIKFAEQEQGAVIEASIAGLTVIEPAMTEAHRTDHFVLSPIKLGPPTDPKPRHMSLPQLLRSTKHPEKVFKKIREELDRTRGLVLAKLVQDELSACLTDAASGCALDSPDGPLRITAVDPTLKLGRDEGAYWLGVGDVTLIQAVKDRVDTYRSDSARIKLLTSPTSNSLVIELIGDVRLQNPAGLEQRLSKDQQIGPLDMPRRVRERYEGGGFEDARLWDRKTIYDLGPEVEHQRKKLRKERSKLLHQIHAEIHVRTVYSISVFVLAMLGAALGIIFRGGQLLVAFGISFVPALLVMVVAILGKNIARGESTLLAGLVVMWAGLLAVMVVDIVVLRRYLPR